jgi:hypothetical protein
MIGGTADTAKLHDGHSSASAGKAAPQRAHNIPHHAFLSPTRWAKRSG